MGSRLLLNSRISDQLLSWDLWGPLFCNYARPAFNVNWAKIMWPKSSTFDF